MKSADLKRVGLKTTLPRLKILEILENSESTHLRPEDIFLALQEHEEEIGLATVYRVLTQLETAGLVKRHHFDEGQAMFEIETGTHHDHLICIKCGKVVEFADEIIEENQKLIAQQEGFKITDHKMVLYGICKDPNCSST